jgi:hypothetical protein
MEVSVPPARRRITQQMCLAFLMFLFPALGIAKPKLGDDEWMRRFRDFVKVFNPFVEGLNEGRFDFSLWAQMRARWKESGCAVAPVH